MPQPGRREIAGARGRRWNDSLVFLLTAMRWEWFKLSHRWLPWILVAVLLAITQLGVWANYFGYANVRRTSAALSVPVAGAEGGPAAPAPCRDVLSRDAARLPPAVSDESLPQLQDECRQLQAQQDHQLAGYYTALTLPGSIAPALNLAVTVGIILMAILAAGHIGAEYAWNTVRPNLVRGGWRWHFCAAQFLLLFLLAGGALLAVVAATMLSSTVARHLVVSPPDALSTDTWRTASRLFGRGWLALAVYVAFAGFFTHLMRSSAAGMAITIGYHLGEQVVVATLSGPVGWFHLVARYLLVQNVAAWVGLSAFGQGRTALSHAHALAVVIVYAVALTLAALSLFQIRDVSGASGG